MPTPSAPTTHVEEPVSRLVFRRRYDVPLCFLLVLGGVTSAGGWTSLLAGTPNIALASELYSFLCLVWVGGAAWLLLVYRGEIVLDAHGLRHGSLLRRKEILWGDVEKLDVVGGFFEPPALVLRLRRPERFLKLLWLRPGHFSVGVHWADRDRLVAEILARVPQAQRSEQARARLEAPHRVAWRYRVTPLAASALAAAVFAYALVDVLTRDATSVAMVMRTVALASLCLPMAGGAIGWEWRWKPWLVRMCGLLGFAVPATWELAVFHGNTDALVLALAAGMGWAAATAVLCLPVRPRARRVVAGYALGLALALVPAWWYGVREPLFSRGTGPLMPGPWQIIWSADGRLVCGLGYPFSNKAQPMCHVVDAASAGVATFPLGDFKYGWLYPAGAGRVLYRAQRETPAGATSELWALDPSSGATQLVHSAPWLRLEENGYLAPDRREALFLAGTETHREAYILRLADLAVRKREPSVDLSRFATASWAPDGRMILVEQVVGNDPLQCLALWSLAQGEKNATPFFQTVAPFLARTLSPNARWAVIATGPDSYTLKYWEVVDLLTGKTCPIDSPLPSPAHFWRMWSPDGKAFGYPVSVPGGESVFVVDPATGKATEAHATRGREVAFVALSHGGRYVACAVNCGMAAQARIIDTQTGQITLLNRIAALQPLVWFAWSPNQPTLAIASFRGPRNDERPTAIRFYELPP